jgi:tetratricopeptide (TPR) repeat protein
VSTLEKSAVAGRYEVKIEAQRDATPQDRSRIIGEKTFVEAKQLSLPGTPNSSRLAIRKYEESLLHWRAASDPNGEADTLFQLGRIHDSLNEKQKALNYLEQALPLRRLAGDVRGEANTLNYIGGVYSDLGEMQRALDYFEQALPLCPRSPRRSCYTH